MPAIGRDRERERLGCGVALVGMGLMKHFRVAFDLGHQLVHLGPGDSYVALDRAGLELEERDAGAVVVRVAARSESQRAGLKPGDVLRAVNGKRVTTARDALAAIAASKNEARVTVSRDGRTLAAPIAMR
jgi:S1-C subfamily serine protease